MKLSHYQASLLKELAYAQVDYLIIGAKAMQAHGIDRDTEDLDLLVEASFDNARRIDPVLRHRALFPLGHTATALTHPNKRIDLGWRDGKREVHEADVLTSIDGIDYGEAKGRRLLIRTHGIAISVASLRDLLHMKEISSRTGNDAKTQARDLWDIDLIQARLDELE